MKNTILGIIFGIIFGIILGAILGAFTVFSSEACIVEVYDDGGALLDEVTVYHDICGHTFETSAYIG